MGAKDLLWNHIPDHLTDSTNGVNSRVVSVNSGLNESIVEIGQKSQAWRVGGEQA